MTKKKSFERKFRQPGATMKDAAGVEVAIYGDDQGAVARNTKTVKTEIGNSVAYARKVVTIIDNLHTAKFIDDYGFDAAYEFKKFFDQAGYSNIKTTNLNGVGGGGMDMADHLAHTIYARQYVKDVYALLGGTKTYLSQSVHYLIGHEMGTRKMVEEQGFSHQGWRGVLVAAIEIMAHEHKNRMYGKRKK